MKKPKCLVLTGDGINCERESAAAFELGGFEAEIRHLNDLIAERMTIDQLSSRYSCLVMPGGFSFGDDLCSGKVLGLKISRALGWDLGAYAARGGLVLGICNGFQALIRMGVFSKDISITQNLQGKFMNSWVKVTPQGSKCVWLKGVGTLDLPIRHGEGRVVLAPNRKKELMTKFERYDMLSLKYEGNPNGSEENIAGLSDTTGRIFGLMPHPEAFVRWTAHPEWTSAPARASAPGQGLVLFENAFREAIQSS